MEVTARVRPTCNLYQAALRIGEKAVVSHVGIGLQIAPITLEELFRPRAFPGGCVIEDHSRMIPVSDIGPKPALARGSRQAPVEHSHRCVVGTRYMRAQHVIFQSIIEWNQQGGIRSRRARLAARRIAGFTSIAKTLIDHSSQNRHGGALCRSRHWRRNFALVLLQQITNWKRGYRRVVRTVLRGLTCQISCALAAGPPSPEKDRPRPLPAIVWMIPSGVTLRIRTFPSSAMNSSPSASTAICPAYIDARTAGPPSPEKPRGPMPATVVIIPVAADTSRNRFPPVEAPHQCRRARRHALHHPESAFCLPR